MTRARAIGLAAAATVAFGIALAAMTIVDLQPYRRATTVAGPDGRVVAELIDLNPNVGDWFLLSLRLAGGDVVAYHLENPRPDAQTLSLDASVPTGIRIVGRDRSDDCPLWDDSGGGGLAQARRSGLPYAPLCDDRVYLRNPVAGRFTRIERITDFLRDHVWGGDEIVSVVRETVYRDAFAERAAPQRESTRNQPPPNAPRAAAIDPSAADAAVDPPHLGIDVVAPSRQLELGAWYAVVEAPGVFVSVIEPRAIDASILASYPRSVATLDPVESAALDYLVALDLGRFDVGFALGTDHPRVGWSERALPAVRDPALPGPDGIDSVAPLVVDGMVSPALVGRTVATFAGGFKREHGAFRYGPFATQDHGTHYGFIEHGVVFSTLQPGLATLYVMRDGDVRMATWRPDDAARLPMIRFARQNGLALLEDDPTAHAGVPGAFVNRWGPGNWSGSQDVRLRTLRAGACLQDGDSTRFLIYGFFSTATPSAMARVFQAYGCRYAMHLDMNALEHTYFALYTRGLGRVAVHHLVDGMAEVDRKGGDRLAPRFLSFPDDRDFFYLTRRTAPPP